MISLKNQCHAWPLSRTIKIFVYLSILSLISLPVLAAPTVTSITPSIGPNTSVSLTDITGTGFSASVNVRLTNEIFNLTHRGSLVHPANGSLLRQPYQVKVSGNYAYLASLQSNALEIVNIANPAAPAHAASLVNNTGGAVLNLASSVFVSGNYAYLAVGAGYTLRGLEIVDITNPAHPVHAAVLLDGQDGAVVNYPRGLCVSGNFVYIANGNDRLSVIDISNPLAPRHEAFLSHGTGGALLKYPYSVAVADHYAYVASRDSNALEIVDLGSTDWAPKGYSRNINVISTTHINGGVFDLTPLPEGRYNLIVINSDGTQGVMNQAFTIINAPPIASFTGSPTFGKTPLTITFTDSSTGSPTNWSWVFGDGSVVNATDQNPVHTYTSGGIFTVNLTVTNATGSNTFSRSNYILATGPPTPPPPTYISNDPLPDNVVTPTKIATVVPTKSPTVAPTVTHAPTATIGITLTEEPVVTPTASIRSTGAAAVVPAKGGAPLTSGTQQTFFDPIIRGISEYLLWFILIGIAIIAAAIVRRWWIHQQNPALFKKE